MGRGASLEWGGFSKMEGGFSRMGGLSRIGGGGLSSIRLVYKL